jgi:UDP-N-acetylglucosamine:LPS N-acetylglucosamine transferase
MSNDSANARINNLAERCAIGLLSLVIGFMFTTYQDQRQDYKALEEKVLVIQMNKVNKEDLKDAVSGINLKMDAMFTNLRQQSVADKQDILQRLDLYFGKLKK